MKITMYELLGLVKDGKAPKKVKKGNIIYELDNKKMIWVDEVYHEVNKDYIWLNFKHINSLNDEVEILEEEKKTKPLTKKDIEALGYACGEIQKCFTNGWTKSLENKPFEEEKKIPEKLLNKFHYTGEEEELANKINEIIDYLKSKGE